MVLDRRAGIGFVVLWLILVSYFPLGFQYVSAPLTSGGVPTRQSDYGVASVFAGQTFMGTLKIKITSDRAAPFFVDQDTHNHEQAGGLRHSVRHHQSRRG